MASKRKTDASTKSVSRGVRVREKRGTKQVEITAADANETADAPRNKEQSDAAKAGGHPERHSREGSKQAQVIAMLRRTEGATVAEIAVAIGWQHHTVRGAIAGALKKKLGLPIVSEKEERGRVYRIAGTAGEAQA
jgi:hypothetical protein